jgi:HlyD family secretion protein
VDVGQTVAASFQTPTLFTIAEDLTKMQIDTNVDEADIGSVKVDQVVRFTVDAYPDTVFKGKISEIRNAPTTVQNVVTYDVVVQVGNDGLKLKPGMTANVSIVTAQRSGVLMVPNSALRFRPSDQTSDTGSGKKQPGSRNKGPAVWVLGDKVPQRIRVATGISDGSFTEIATSSLKEGQEVIVGKNGQAGKAQDAGRPPRFFH